MSFDVHMYVRTYVYMHNHMAAIQAIYRGSWKVIMVEALMEGNIKWRI